MDSGLAALFATSLGPIKTSTHPKAQFKTAQQLPEFKPTPDPKGKRSKDASEFTNDLNRGHRPKKRKISDASSTLEAQYLLRLANSEQAHDESLKGWNSTRGSGTEQQVSTDAATRARPEIDDSQRFGHGPIGSDREVVSEEFADQPNAEEQSMRTLFISNVPMAAVTSKTARKTLEKHLASPFSADGSRSPIQSIRFRSTPYSASGLPRKASYITKAVMPTTARSTHAYVVYRSRVDAERAVELLNGTVVLDRHIRVDSISDPMEQDHRRCIFVGNLGFVDDETAVNRNSEDSTRPSKMNENADYEEGLWRIFGQIGTVDSVRMIRDKTTQVGKGFAYVQFREANAVEKALLHNDRKFPPLLPRKLRVARARKATGGNKRSLLPRNATTKPRRLVSGGHAGTAKSTRLGPNKSSGGAHEGRRATPGARHAGRPTKRSKAFRARERSKGNSS